MPKKESQKNFLLRLDASTMERLEAWAADEFRSLNGQLQWIIADSLKRHRRIPKSRRQRPDQPAADDCE